MIKNNKRWWRIENGKLLMNNQSWLLETGKWKWIIKKSNKKLKMNNIKSTKNIYCIVFIGWELKHWKSERKIIPKDTNSL